MIMRFKFMLFLSALIISNAAHAQAFRGHNTKAPIDYSADRSEGFFKDGKGVFSGNVVVKQADLTMTAGRVTIAIAKGKGTELERIDAAGGVTVRRGAESAMGNFAIYDPYRKLITMIGNVVLTQNDNSVRGSRLVIDLETGRAVVDGATQLGEGATSTGANGRVSGRFTVPDRGN
jgi:lipopolysaccharide export system protein LptA